MNKLQEIQKSFNNKLAEVKYQYAVSLLELISDEDYAKLNEDNEELLAPIAEQDGETYLHNQDTLDKIIKVFTNFIQNKTPNPDDMGYKELMEYIKSLIEPLDEDRLRGITKVIQNMLGL